MRLLGYSVTGPKWLWYGNNLCLYAFLFYFPYLQRQAVRTPWFKRTARLTGAQPGEGAVVAKTGWLRLVFQLLLWALVVLALARPQFGQRVSVLTREGIDLVVAIDTSASMLAQDVEPDANRLEAARRIAGGLFGLAILKARAGD